MITRWDPFGDLEEVYERMGRLLEGGSYFGEGARSLWVPPADVEETEDSYTVALDLPGVKRDDVSVEVSDRDLTIRGEIREHEHAGVVHRHARHTGRFDYRLSLPGEVDPEHVAAKLEDGVMTARLPKATPAHARKIPLTAG
ncbi:MAG: Hsp20/alpha crystallin family protein [Streptosporangiaceae bacterium]